jgi:hypothetical protein
MTPSKRPAAKKKAPSSTASEIAPGVFVGGWNDAVGFSGTRVCVLDELPAEPVPGSTHIPIYDESTDQAIPGNLEKVAALVAAARAKNEPALMFCGHGVRRGSLAGAWYLHRSEGISLDAAYDRVRAVRPQIQHINEWVGGWKALEEAALQPAPKGRTARAP